MIGGNIRANASVGYTEKIGELFRDGKDNWAAKQRDEINEYRQKVGEEMEK